VEYGYRVHVPRRSYRGSNPKKRAEIAEDQRLCWLIEEELQKRYDALPLDEPHAIMSYEIAHAIGEDTEKVRRIVFRIQGGSNGVTFMKQSK
jgi:hypothetical protein